MVRAISWYCPVVNQLYKLSVARVQKPDRSMLSNTTKIRPKVTKPGVQTQTLLHFRCSCKTVKSMSGIKFIHFFSAGISTKANSNSNVDCFRCKVDGAMRDSMKQGRDLEEQLTLHEGDMLRPLHCRLAAPQLVNFFTKGSV